MLKENTNWYLHTGVLVKSAMGARGLDPDSLDSQNLNSAFANGSMERKLNYFNVPILLRYKFKSDFYVEAGPMLGLLYKANEIYSADVIDNDDLNYSLDVVDEYRRIDAGVEGGFGYHVMKGTGYNLGVRYYYGLNGLLKDTSADPQKNSSIYLYASIPVGAGEKAKAKARAKKEEREAKKALKGKP
jgi:hypothetical protein